MGKGGSVMQKSLTLAREDINNPLHPFLWQEICQDLGFEDNSPDGEDNYPDTIHLTIISAEKS